MTRSSFRRTVQKKTLIAILCMLASVSVLTELAAAQHPGGRVGGGGMPTPAPPIHVYAPSPIRTVAPPIHIFAPPIAHTPTIMPRTAVIPAGSAPARANLLYRPRPIRPVPPVIFIYSPTFFLGWPGWGFNACWWATCDLAWGLGYYLMPVSSYGPAIYVSEPVYEAPVYAYGEERPEYPQLYLKDGTIYNVTDYWLIDDQLHFTMNEGDATKPAEHVIGFDQLDLQRTVDADTQRGFRFVLRNEPIDQYLRDHPDSPPPAVLGPKQ